MMIPNEILAQVLRLFNITPNIASLEVILSMSLHLNLEFKKLMVSIFSSQDNEMLGISF